MLLGHYRNTIFENRTQIPTKFENIFVTKEKLEEKDFSSLNLYESARISKDNLTMSINNNQFQLALSSKTPEGIYYVCEKWENPYYRSNRNLLLFGDSNPIGNYLIILSDLNHNKIPYSLHKWPGSKKFKPCYETAGCIRFKPEEMENIFNSLDLGTCIEVF